MFCNCFANTYKGILCKVQDSHLWQIPKVVRRSGSTVTPLKEWRPISLESSTDCNQGTQRRHEAQHPAEVNGRAETRRPRP